MINISDSPMHARTADRPLVFRVGVCRTFWMVEASVQMCICEIVMGVVLATQMDPVTGALPWNATIGLIVVVSDC